MHLSLRQSQAVDFPGLLVPYRRVLVAVFVDEHLNGLIDHVHHRRSIKDKPESMTKVSFSV